jgi:DTW domain-containing protein YfiP
VYMTSRKCPSPHLPEYLSSDVTMTLNHNPQLLIMTAASVAAIRYRQRTVAAALSLLIIHCTSVLKCQAFSTSTRSEVLRASANCSRRHVIQEGQDLGNGVECERVLPPFDEELYNFYRSDFSSKNKRLVPSLPISGNDDDSVYILRAKNQQQHDIVAAVRLTRSKICRDYTFLRAACVSRNYRRQGLALRILKESIADFGASHYYYCFASPELQPLYQQAGFSLRTNDTDDLPQWLVQSFTPMATRLRRKRQSLDLFVKSSCTEEVDPSSSSSPGVDILLLQHANESRRKTATGWLLDDELFQNAICIGDSVRGNGYSLKLSKYMNLNRWTWSGRDDNSVIEEQLGQLEYHAVLLWTDAGGGGGSSENVLEAAKNDKREDEKPSQCTYVILDGTWQEAKAMFRKIPGLWKLPRLFLSTTDTPSTYTLRKDYSGWQQRFSSGDGKDLLCTAEVAAALMDRTGDNISANEIRYRLNAFQENFQQITFNRDTSENQ